MIFTEDAYSRGIDTHTINELPLMGCVPLEPNLAHHNWNDIWTHVTHLWIHNQDSNEEKTYDLVGDWHCAIADEGIGLDRVHGRVGTKGAATLMPAKAGGTYGNVNRVQTVSQRASSDEFYNYRFGYIWHGESTGTDLQESENLCGPPAQDHTIRMLRQSSADNGPDTARIYTDDIYSGGSLGPNYTDAIAAGDEWVQGFNKIALNNFGGIHFLLNRTYSKTGTAYNLTPQGNANGFGDAGNIDFIAANHDFQGFTYSTWIHKERYGVANGRNRGIAHAMEHLYEGLQVKNLNENVVTQILSATNLSEFFIQYIKKDRSAGNAW